MAFRGKKPNELITEVRNLTGLQAVQILEELESVHHDLKAMAAFSNYLSKIRVDEKNMLKLTPEVEPRYNAFRGAVTWGDVVKAYAVFDFSYPSKYKEAVNVMALKEFCDSVIDTVVKQTYCRYDDD